MITGKEINPFVDITKNNLRKLQLKMIFDILFDAARDYFKITSISFS